MKYLIKAFYGDWKEVTKEYADSFIDFCFSSQTKGLTRQQVEDMHLKIIKDEEVETI